MPQYMIEAINITKRFPGTVANDHICLRVRAGEIMGLVGENGAGKSTILKCLNGVYPHGSFEGEILIEGKPAAFRTPLDAMRCGIGFVPQEINVLGDMNVAENIFLFDLKNGKKHAFVDHRALRSRTEKLRPALTFPGESAGYRGRADGGTTSARPWCRPGGEQRRKSRCPAPGTGRRGG